MSPQEQQLVDSMKSAGVPANAGRIYLYLLRHAPATGYEISQRAGVTRSAIYANLNRLRDMNLVAQVGDRPPRYEALSPQAFLDRLEQSHRSQESDMRSWFDNFIAAADPVTFVEFDRYDEFIAKVKDHLFQARESIYLSIWPDELHELMPVLTQDTVRSRDLVLFSLARFQSPAGECYSQQMSLEDLYATWRPGFSAVIDRRLLLMATQIDRPHIKAIMTNQEVVIATALNQLVLDITLVGKQQDRSVQDVVKRMLSG